MNTQRYFLFGSEGFWNLYIFDKKIGAFVAYYSFQKSIWMPIDFYEFVNERELLSVLKSHDFFIELNSVPNIEFLEWILL